MATTSTQTLLQRSALLLAGALACSAGPAGTTGDTGDSTGTGGPASTDTGAPPTGTGATSTAAVPSPVRASRLRQGSSPTTRPIASARSSSRGRAWTTAARLSPSSPWSRIVTSTVSSAAMFGQWLRAVVGR